MNTMGALSDILLREVLRLHTRSDKSNFFLRLGVLCG
jgi:hypothetical protein